VRPPTLTVVAERHSGAVTRRRNELPHVHQREVVIPDGRHALAAPEDSVVLLTVVKTVA
jgi:hypothetical protein